MLKFTVLSLHQSTAARPTLCHLLTSRKPPNLRQPQKTSKEYTGYVKAETATANHRKFIQFTWQHLGSMAARTFLIISISPSTSHYCCANSSDFSSYAPWSFKLDNLLSSFVGHKLSIRSSNSRQYIPKNHPSAVATVSFSLPTAKPGRASSGKAPKWSARSIKSFAMAELEARKLKYPNTGTEALLMGILVEGTSLAAKFLRENGITLFKVREDTVKLLGKSDLYFFSPEHPPLTEPAQRALDWAVDEQLKSGEDGEITTAHLLLGIWSEKESAGHKIMAGLGFDDEKAKELAKSMNKDIILSFK